MFDAFNTSDTLKELKLSVTDIEIFLFSLLVMLRVTDSLVLGVGEIPRS